MSVEQIVSQLRALDVETHRIQDGLLAPPLVVGSTAKVARGTEQLLHPKTVLDGLRRIAEETDEILTGANIAYDFGVTIAEDPTLLGPVFRLFDERRVYDVLLGEALDAIAAGHLFKQADGRSLINPATGKQSKKYSLDIVTQLETGRVDAKKNDYWRLRYAILQHVPWSDWPLAASQYPLDDARNTVDSAASQLRRGARNVGDMPAQAETAFGLHLGAMWGFRSSRERTEALAARADAAHAASVAKFTKLGFLRRDGTEDTVAVKRAVALAYGVDPRSQCVMCRGWGRVPSPKGAGATVVCARKLGGCDGTGLDLSTSLAVENLLTPSGGISTTRDALVESGDEALAEYAENPWEKIRQTYIPWMRQGYDRPITLKPNVLVASGRTSYEDPSQTFPRKHGVRDCIQARDGYYFLSVDYAAIELCALAQVCYWLFGYSSMRDIINSTGDPGALHSSLGGRLVGKSLDEMKVLLKAGDKQAKDARQGAKPCFHPDTEILTRRGWIKVSALTYEDEVASAVPGAPVVEAGRLWVSCQLCGEKFGVKPSEVRRRGGKYCSRSCRTSARNRGLVHSSPDLGEYYSGEPPSMKIVWTKPTHLTVRQASEGLVHLKNESIDLRVTPDHRMLVCGWTSKLDVVEARHFGPQRSFYNAGMAGGDVEADERLLRLAVATQADGNYSGSVIRLGFSKQRKIEQLYSLLRDGEFELRVYPNGEHQDTTYFYLAAPLAAAVKGLLDADKTLPWWWLRLTSRLREVVLDEARHWDAHQPEDMQGYLYSSSLRKNIDVLQALASITDRKAQEHKPSLSAKSIDYNYTLSVKAKRDSRGGSVGNTAVPYIGAVYCLTVPSGFVLVRDGGKPVVVGQCNFGLPGGMGAAKLVLNQRSSANGSTKAPDGKEYPGVRFCILLGGAQRCGTEKITEWKRRPCPPACKACVEVCEYVIKPAWFAEFPEIREYFSWVKWQVETYGEIAAFGPVDRVRGGLGFTDGANTNFQSLNADGGKYAWRRVIRACYTQSESPLWGTRPILFAHDEIFAETPRWKADPAAREMSRLMVESMRVYVPDVTVRAEPALMRFWFKEAQMVENSNGVLIPWEPEEKVAA
ncbi:MAG: hypothetical protein AABZ84_05925 [Pseudomonadota bacterium]